MQFPPGTIYDSADFDKDENLRYKNLPVTNVNDHIIRISLMTEPFYWHRHPNSDESFLVVEGVIFIDLDDRTIELCAGQIFTVPMNVNHRTRPKTARSVNLTFEKENMETIKTG